MSDAAVTSDTFRQAMARFATGVTVVTSRWEGLDHAMTANSVASVSLDPLLLLVCVEQESRFHDAIIGSGRFGVSILDAASRATADWLATRGRPLHGQLGRTLHHHGPATGVALLDTALATIECQTVDTHPAGDHTIVVGEVLSVQIADHPGDALLYYRGRFETLK
ncbi:MAG: flavin reductase family protein [Lapillicoccus sp.]